MPTSIPASTLEKFTNFGDLLRFLRRAAGLTQLELSIQVGYSHAQISRLEQNLRLPDIPTLEARFVPALGLEDQPKAITRLLELAANVRREDAPGLGLCPYKGLNYFDESDADLFVGREALTAKLLERVLDLTASEPPPGIRFLAIVGASGSGKSSLVRAGLVPALRWNKKSSDWQIHILTPTAHPIESLAASLTNESDSVTATTTLMDDLSRDPRSLQVFVKRQMPNPGYSLFVIDQFEELFALCHADEERITFIENLLAAASETDGPVIVLITLRADFYAHCANYIHLREALARNQEYIGAMKEEELCRAIEEPARRGRWEFEPGLVNLLLHDVGHEPGALPLLSHALFETWQRRRGRLMTLSGYASSGGVRGAIAETAETVFTDQFTSHQRSIARRIFLRLTELSDEAASADTRRRATFNELILKPEEASTTRAVLKALADARLIITSEDSAEVAHEALIREWPTLQSWLAENRDSLRLHRQLTEAAQEWLDADRASDILYRGARLAQARELALTHEEEMNTLEREFLAASIDASERQAAEREAQRQRELEAAQSLAEALRQRAEAEQQRAEIETQRAEDQIHTAGQLRKRALYLTAAFTMALMMALTALFFGSQARQAAITAQKQKQIATSRELAIASLSNLGVDPERSILLALEALKNSHTLEAEDALHHALQASHVQLVLPAGEPGAPMILALSPDGSQFVTASAEGSVNTWDFVSRDQLMTVSGHFAAYSPDGKWLAVVTLNRPVRIIDLATGEEISLPNEMDATLTVAFSPDSSRLVTIVRGNLPTVWDVTTGEKLAEFPGHTDYVGFASFSPDGTRLLTSSDDGTARVWDITTGRELFVLSDHPSGVWSARYSPNGQWIATLSGNEAYLWDAGSGTKRVTLTGHKNDVYAIAFSPDGTRIATGSVDRKIKIWDGITGEEALTLSGHTGAIYDITFSTDGTQLVSGSDDGTVRVWNIVSNSESFPFFSKAKTSGQFALSADGTRLVTSDMGGTKVWDTTSGKELQSLKNSSSLVSDLAFSPDQKKVFIAEGTKVSVWEMNTSKRLGSIAGHTGIINSIAINKEGTRLATASDDYKVKIWNISSDNLLDRPLLTLEHSGIVYSVAFSSDGLKLATGVQDGTTKLWDLSNGKEILTLRGHTDFVKAVAFNPEGTRLATASWDGTAKIWDLATGEELFTLRGHTGSLTSIAYSPDGMHIATASRDGAAKLWDAITSEEWLTFSGDGSELQDVSFSRDGTRLVTGSEHGAQVYLLRIEDLIALAQTRLTRSLTSEECQKYLHRDPSDCATTTTVPTSSVLPPAENQRVCQVTNTGGLNDNSFNEMIFSGLQESNKKFGWDPQVLESSSMQDFDRNITEFLSGDCDLIVGVVPMNDAIRVAAENNPNQKFLMMDFPFDPPLENVWTQLYAADQAAFLAGYVAASVTKTGKVGIFGGVDIPPVIEFMDGFALGIAYYNEKNGTHVEVLGWDPGKQEGLFVGGWCCLAEGRELTEQLLEDGAGIILPVAGIDIGAGAASAVLADGNSYLIGVDSDWTATLPEYTGIVLTSILKNLDVSVVQVVKAIEDRTFRGGVHIGTLETGEVGLAPFHTFDSLIPAQVKADLEQIRKEIIAGTLQTRP